MPTLDELKALCAKGETKAVEFKSELSDSVLKELSTDLAALANTEGGVIIVGVDDDRRPIGFVPRPRHEDRNRVSTEAQNCNPPVQVDFDDLSFGHLNFLVITIQIDASLHQDKASRFPFRVGDRTVYLDTAGVIAQLNARNLTYRSPVGSGAWGDWVTPGRVQLVPTDTEERSPKPPVLAARDARLLSTALESEDRMVQDEALEELRRISWSIPGWYDRKLFSVLKDILKSGDDQHLHLCFEIIRGSIGPGEKKRRDTVAEWFRDLVAAVTMPPASVQTMMEAFQVLKEFHDESVVSILLRWAEELDDPVYKTMNLQFVVSNFKHYGYMEEARRRILTALTNTKSEKVRSRLADLLKALRQYGG